MRYEVKQENAIFNKSTQKSLKKKGKLVGHLELDMNARGETCIPQ